MATKKTKTQKVINEFKVKGEHLVTKVKEIVKEGNVRKITIKDKTGDTLLVIPMTLGVVGALLVPTLAAIGAVAALVTDCTVTVEKKKK